MLQKLKGSTAATARAAVAAAPQPTGRTRLTLKQRFSKGEVEWSPDFERIMKLPRRNKPELDAIAKALTDLLKRPEGKQTLRDLQAWALYEAPHAGGLIASLAPGSGKTLISLLLPMVWPYVRQQDGTMRAPRCVLLIPADARVQFAADYKRYGEHWRLPNLAGHDKFQAGLPVLHVLTYSELQQPKNSALLEQLQPDLLTGDEISALRNFEAARTIRARRFFGRFYETSFCGMDGTILNDSVEDIWHLLAWALGENSPMPTDPAEVRRWARAIDQDFDDGYYMPGVLMQFCAPGEQVRQGFRRRFVDTLGVVTSEDQQLGIPLIFKQRMPPQMPLQVMECLKTLRRPHQQGGWRRPDGEELQDATQVAACARQLATGFYLRWKYPRGEPVELIDEWFEKRQAWNREIRAQLQMPLVHLDSEKLWRNAATRWFDGGCPGCARGPQEPHGENCPPSIVASHPLWSSYTFEAWREIEDKVYHETEAVWLSEWLLDDVAAWAREAPGLIWVEHPEIGERLAQRTGLKYYGGGDAAAEELDRLYGDGTPRSQTSIIVSVKATMRGRNLQSSFWRNLIISFPASNSVVEQLAGRTYRPGQTNDRVEVHYYLHTPEFENALEHAQIRARRVWETMGNTQKLVYAQWEKAAA